MDWFLYDNGLRYERVNRQPHKIFTTADKLFECAWPFCEVGAERVKRI